MNLDLNMCRSISGKCGLPLDFVVKEFHLFDVLGQVTKIFGEEGYLDKVVFKGGTALNKVYFTDLQRFSEDLDFDLGDSTPSTVYSFCKELAGKIQGYEIKEFRRVRATSQFYCIFDSPLGRKDHVRVDISPKKIITSQPLVIGTAYSSFTDRTVTGFRVYSLEDLVARKLNALVDRAKGRDIYDVYTAWEKTHNLPAAIEKSLKSEGKHITVKEFLQLGVAKLEKVDAKQIMRLTNPIIPPLNRPRDWKVKIDTLKQNLLALASNA